MFNEFDVANGANGGWFVFQCKGERPFVSLKEYDLGVGLDGL